MTLLVALPSGSHPDVVEEHLDEAAFLCLQRGYLARTGAATWARLSPIESRFEAHLVGLAVAGPEGRDFARTAAGDGVPGAAHVAVCLLCRADDADGALALAASIDAARVGEAIDALAHDAPPSWTGRLAAELDSDNPRRQRIAAAVIGASRRPAGIALLRALAQTSDAETEAALVRALGDLRYPPARSVLGRASESSPQSIVAQSTAKALLRFGDPRALTRAKKEARTHARAVLHLALAGDRRHGALLANAVRADHAEAPIALGILGDPAHIPLLLDLLDAPATAAPAALGLRTLTGAPLTEEVLVLDDPDDPDLGGDLVTRVSQHAADWRAWWAEHGGALPSGARVRAGQPFSPLGAVTSPVGGLADDLLPASLRNALADELAGRYGLDAPFRADAFVAHQRASLASLAGSAANARASEGEWGTPRRTTTHGR